MKKWKVAAYLRLSSDDGDKMESNSIGNQRSIIKQYVTNNKEIENVKYYTDDGFSGTTFDRPDFKNLINDIECERINCIIVKDLSRLGRNYIEVGKYMEDFFPKYNVRFIAINDNIDSYEDPKSINSVIVPFKNLMNDEYARDISNKVRSVLDNKKINGQFIGSTAPYGYIRDPDDKHKFIIDTKSARIVKKIFKMILDGSSRKEVAIELNALGVLPPALYKTEEAKYNYKIKENMKVWNNKKIDKILKNESYIGNLVQGKRRKVSHKIHKTLDVAEDEWVIIPNHHRAIIDKEDFYKVQDIIYDRNIRIKKDNKLDIFSGHLSCNECGNSLILRKSKGHEYYYCSSYIKKKGCSSHGCKKTEIKKNVLDTINNYKKLISDIDYKIDEILNNKEINYDLEIINNKIKDYEEKLQKYILLRNSIKDDLKDKFIDENEFWEYNNEYSKEINKIKEEISKLEKKVETNCFKSTENKEWIKRFSDENKIEEINKKIIDELIEDIIIDKNKNIKIVFKYQDKYFEALGFINRNKCDII